jgi:hypothetical protein
MLPPFRPAVVACPKRYMHDEKPKSVWPPPYPAWPEIAEPSTFYSLPALSMYYGISQAVYWPSADYCAHKRICVPKSELEIITLKSHQSLSREIARAMAMEGSSHPEWDAFAFFHEMGHCQSFSMGRKIIHWVSGIAYDLLTHLRPANVAQCDNFWTEFRTRNGRLVNGLEKGLVFEEIRANMFAFALLDSQIMDSIEEDVRECMAEEGNLSLFDEIATAANRFWLEAWMTTLSCEVYSPIDPISGLRRLPDEMAIDRRNWVKEWATGFLTRISETRRSNHRMARQPKYRSFNGLIQREFGWQIQLTASMGKMLQIKYYPPDEDEVDTINLLSLSDIREVVFLESLRQQLAQFSGVSLVCPFQQRGRTCCGFGHYLRAVWEKALPEYRSAKSILHPKTGKELAVRPPRKACLNYGLG